MKNFLTVLTAWLIILTLIGGCKKDSPSDPVVIPPAKLQIDVKVDKDTVTKGGQVTFTWTSQNAVSCTVSINGVKETIAVNGVKSYPLNQNTIFQFVFAAKDGGTETKNFTIIVTEVIPPKAPTIHVSSLYTQIPYNGNSTITITTTDADSVTSNLVGVHGTSGSFATPSLQSTTTYHFKAYGKGGTAVDSVKIIVDPKPPMTRFEIITQPEGFHPIVKYMEFPNGHKDTAYNLPQIDWLSNYYTNGSYEIHKISTNVLIGNGLWYLLDNETKLLMAVTAVYNIDYIEPTRMILSIVETCLGCPNGETVIATYDYRLYSKK